MLYDLIVIGSGPAGQKAALQGARAGKRVAAYGAAAKGNTLLNFAGIHADRRGLKVTAEKSKASIFPILCGSTHATTRSSASTADASTAPVGQASACHVSTRPTRLATAPYRFAGRSLRPSRPSLTRMCLRCAIHGFAGRQGRLNGRSNPEPIPFQLRRLLAPRVLLAGVFDQRSHGWRSVGRSE